MELRSAIEKRATVRKFKDTPIPEEDLKEMVRRAGLAPSVNNEQPWKFIAVTNKAAIEHMADVVHKKVRVTFPADSNQEERIKSTVEYFSTVFEKAPALIAVADRPYKAVSDELVNESLTHSIINEMRHYPGIQSLGAAVENLLLTAVDLGYGACWLSGLMLAKNELEQILNIQSPWHLATIVAVGVPDGEPKQRDKNPVGEIFELIK